MKSDSGSSEDFAPNAVPLDVMSSVQDYMNGVDNLVASTKLWSKADALISMHCKGGLLSYCVAEDLFNCYFLDFLLYSWKCHHQFCSTSGINVIIRRWVSLPES